MNDNKNLELTEDEALFCTMTDEEGNEIDFEVIGEAELDGTVYYAMEPVGAEDAEDGVIEYVLLKKVTDEDGEDMFESIDDEAEFDKVAAYFDDLFDSEADYDV
ncbi:MAG: DUF1292 domain-containing protein [Ruminococcaceae bacterium]|nr:DUF1292 domain-containing protein [Oscillospiraceae bacterium]